MDKDFVLLSVKEEKELSTEELKEYYKKLREYALSRKLTFFTFYGIICLNYEGCYYVKNKS